MNNLGRTKMIEKSKKAPLIGATQFPASRHQTGDGHDHGFFKSKERRCCNMETCKSPVYGSPET